MYTIERHGYQRTQYSQAKAARDWYRKGMQVYLSEGDRYRAMNYLELMVTNANIMSEQEELECSVH